MLEYRLYQGRIMGTAREQWEIVTCQPAIYLLSRELTYYWAIHCTHITYSVWKLILPQVHLSQSFCSYSIYSFSLQGTIHKDSAYLHVCTCLIFCVCAKLKPVLSRMIIVGNVCSVRLFWCCKVSVVYTWGPSGSYEQSIRLDAALAFVTVTTFTLLRCLRRHNQFHL